jgi:ATP-dependent DNA helicase RecG
MKTKTGGLKSSGKTRVEAPVKTPEKILQLLQQNPNLSLADLAASIGKSVSATERASSKLVKEGKLRRIGPAKGGQWDVLQ